MFKKNYGYLIIKYIIMKVYEKCFILVKIDYDFLNYVQKEDREIRCVNVYLVKL